jgi:hypothetical protein
MTLSDSLFTVIYSHVTTKVVVIVLRSHNATLSFIVMWSSYNWRAIRLNDKSIHDSVMEHCCTMISLEWVFGKTLLRWSAEKGQIKRHPSLSESDAFVLSHE